MNIREKIVKALDNLSEDELEGVLEYIRLVQEFEEVEDEQEVIARGKEEISRGEVVNWRDIKTDTVE